jgi:flagellar motor switch protein FliG
VLAYLESDHAAEVLSLLPSGVRAEVVVRIASLDGVQPSALTELDDIIEKQFSGNGAAKTSALGGPKAAADIMNALEPSHESAVMEQIKKSDEALAQVIEDLVFTFEDLIDLDDRSMQELLRQVPGDGLLLALKGAEDALKDKIFKNMSQRAAEMLKDDLESKGPVRIADVEGAQKTILQTARKLADAGTIALGGKGDEYV